MLNSKVKVKVKVKVNANERSKEKLYIDEQDPKATYNYLDVCTYSH